MTEKNYPPISPGTTVITTEPNWGLRGEWTDEGWQKRKWGALGKVLAHHDSHGLYYDVKHEDGTMAGYDPSELEVVKTEKVLLVGDKENLSKVLFTLGRLAEKCPEDVLEAHALDYTPKEITEALKALSDKFL